MPPIPSILCDKLGFLLWKAGQKVGESGAKTLQKVGLTLNTRACLLLICYQDIQKQEELSSAARINRNQIVKAVDDLERLRFAKRVRTPDNRRVFHVVPTQKGREALATSEILADEFNRSFFAALSAVEQDTLKGFLARILDSND